MNLELGWGARPGWRSAPLAQHIMGLLPKLMLRIMQISKAKEVQATARSLHHRHYFPKKITETQLTVEVWLVLAQTNVK